MKHAIITGATSFVGLELTKRLMENDVETHVIKRPQSDISRFDDLPSYPRLHDYDGTVASLQSAFTMSQADTVFHIAGKYARTHQTADIDPLIEANLRFGTHILEAMSTSKQARYLINTGSYFQYYDSLEPRAVNLYAALKNAFADILDYYCDATDIYALTLVLFDTYGPGDWRHKLMTAVRDAQKTGASLPVPGEDLELDFVYVDDVVDAFIYAARFLKSETIPLHHSYAVSSGAPLRISQLIKKFESIGNRSIDVEHGKWPPQNRIISTPWQGACLPGWTPKITIDEGIHRLLESP